MAHVVVFHHARGLTPGVQAFADVIGGLGHHVVVPDLYDGQLFDVLDDGVAYAEGIGFESLAENGAAAAPAVDGLIVIGFSLGALPAQRLAQTRAGVRAAVLCHSAVPLGVFGEEWPDDVALRVHLCDEDPWAAEDREAALELVDSAVDGELILHRGSGHLVCDPTDADHGPVVAAAILDQILRLLDEVDSNDRTDEHGRPEPRPDTDELETLLGFLEYQRATLAWKCAGLDEAGLAQTVGDSTMTLGGLLKHASLVESSWFRRVLHGEDRCPPWNEIDWSSTPDWDWESAADDSAEELHRLWSSSVADSRWGTVMALASGGLDQKAIISWEQVPNLRWILAHMIEEYARHNGHADLLREAVDGQTGE